MKKHEKKKRGKLQFSKKWKIAIFLEIFHFFKFVLSFFYHSSSFLLPVVQKKIQEMENYNFPRVFFIFFYHFCYHFLSFLLPVVELVKNDKKWWKMIKQMKQTWKKTRKIAIFQKMKNCNFPRVFFICSCFFHFFIMFLSFFLSFLLPVVELMQNDKKMMKNDEKNEKNEKKMIKKWNKLEENCSFPFLGKFLHHWKQKWWKMIKNDKKMIKKMIKKWLKKW